jgi:hypothetical protein
MGQEFKQPPKYCKNGHLIPGEAGYKKDKYGNTVVAENGNALRTGPRSICEICAAQVDIPDGVKRLLDKPRKRKSGEKIAEQATIDEVLGPLAMQKIN